MSAPDDLKQQFTALRDEDAEQAPPFAATLAAARAQQKPRASATWGWTALIGTAAAIGAIALALGVVGPRVSTPGDGGPLPGSVDQWIAPTDALLASVAPTGSPESMFRDTGDDIAFFESPTADLLGIIDDPTVRTP